MTFARLHKTVSFLIAGLGLLAVGLGDELTPAAKGATCVAFAGSWFAEGRWIHDPRWSVGWTVGLFAFLGLQVARGLLGEPALPLALEFTCALQLSRLFSRRSAKEHQQIAGLSLLHLVAATVISTELSYAFVFLGFLVVTPWALSLGHLRAEIESDRRDVPSEDYEGFVDRVLRSRRLIGPGFLAGTAALGLPLFALTGLLFVAFPRVGLGFIPLGRDTGRHVSGFGANVELGEFGVIRTDPTVVLRVRPPDLSAQPPRSVAIRMRGTSFDHYDGRRWSRSGELESRRVPRIDSHYPVPVRLPRPEADRPWQVLLEPLDEPVIFLPPHTMGLEIPPRITGGLEVGREIAAARGIDVRYLDADGLGLRYTAWVSDTRSPEAPNRPDDSLTAEEVRRYLQVPDGHERVAALARRWTMGATEDAERVKRLRDHLRDSGEFTYSLEMPRVDDRAPLVGFLFEARRGHCEYYSTALAIMLRTLGVPARNVTGFVGGRFNPYGRYYALRQGDAHSWVEVWLPGEGWVTVDSTPAARGELAPDAGWLPAFGEMIDALRTRWSQDVVGYDLRRQVSLLRAVRQWLALRPAPRARSHPPDRRAESPATSCSEGGSWLWLVSSSLVLGLGGLVWWSRRRRHRARDTEAVALYRELDRALTKLGLARPANRTPLEHVAVLADADFAEIDLVREVTRRYLAVRFGGHRASPGEFASLRRKVRALRRRAGRPLR